ncbi:MAG: sulfatase-like hydrolase/transferase [Bacteroidales bacterium]
MNRKNPKSWKSPVNQRFASGLAFFLLMLTVQQTTAQERPNFLWIVSEDNSKHYMELFDPRGIATPTLQGMAEKGILFTRAFSNAPVCSVARSSLISACYAPRTGTQYHRKSVMVPMPDGIRMFPAYLRDGGYYTTNNHKEDYNYIKSEGTWDESSPDADWTHRAPGQPFFHMESHPETHESCLHFGAELMDSYVPVTDPKEVFLFPQHPDTELFRFTAAYYRDRILLVDSIVQGVLDRLEKEGELENTFVFYFGDHGGVLPGSKGYLYESGLHVPLVVRIPEHFRHLVGEEAGTTSERFVSFIDFGPTLLALAGIPLPDGIDGIPFLGNALPETVPEKDGITYGYADRFDEKYDMVRTVRKGNLKYMRSYQPFNFDGLQNNYRYLCLAYQQWRGMFEQGKLNPVQRAFFESRQPEALYDLEADPYETQNLAFDPSYRKALLEMRGLLNGWVRKMPDLSFYPECILRQEAFENPVRFGQTHRQAIGALADIADLELLPFEAARERIGEALLSEDPLKNYWGLIVCSSFGKEAAPFFEQARRLSAHPNLLVRTRAAEFLAITGETDPVPLLSEALTETNDPWEGLLILNSMVLLKDGYGYDFSGAEPVLASRVKNEPEVGRRLEYLWKESSPVKKP